MLTLRRTFTTLRNAALCALIVASLSGCFTKGSGTEATEVRELEPFHEIEVGGIFDLTVHVDPEAAQRVQVRGDDNLVAMVETKVSGGSLDIGLEGWIRPKLDLEVIIWVPALEGVEISGSADFQIDGLSGERFELEVSGASDSELEGTVGSLVIESSGSSEVAAKQLRAESVEIDVSGAADVEVWASKSLDVDVSGSGDVRYHGDPEDIVQTVSGAGKVEPAP